MGIFSWTIFGEISSTTFRTRYSYQYTKYNNSRRNIAEVRSPRKNGQAFRKVFTTINTINSLLILLCVVLCCYSNRQLFLCSVLEKNRIKTQKADEDALHKHRTVVKKKSPPPPSQFPPFILVYEYSSTSYNINSNKGQNIRGWRITQREFNMIGICTSFKYAMASYARHYCLDTGSVVLGSDLVLYPCISAQTSNGEKQK